MASHNIPILVNGSQANAAFGQIRNSAREADNAATRLKLALQRAFDLLALALAGRELVRMSDQVTSVEGRLKALGITGASTKDIMNDLFKVAMESRVPFEAVSELYTRVTLATQSLGRSHEENIGFVEALGKAVKISGASTQEATAGMIQLSQALASGRLQGDEFRSIMENLPIVAQVLAEHFHVTIGELREFSKQGKITSQDIMDAFAEASTHLDEIFAKLPVTFEQAFSNLYTKITQLVYNIGSVVNTAGIAAGAINNFANNLDRIALVLSPTIILGTVAAINRMYQAIRASAIVMGLFNIAALQNPIIRWATIISTAVLALFAFSKELASSAHNMADFLMHFGSFMPLGNVMMGILGGLIKIFAYFADGLTVVKQAAVTLGIALGLIEPAAKTASDSVEDLTHIMAAVPTEYDRAAAAATLAGERFQQFGQTGADAAQTVKTGVDSLNESLDKSTASIYEVGQALDTIPESVTSTIIINTVHTGGSTETVSSGASPVSDTGTDTSTGSEPTGETGGSTSPATVGTTGTDISARTAVPVYSRTSTAQSVMQSGPDKSSVVINAETPKIPTFDAISFPKTIVVENNSPSVTINTDVSRTVSGVGQIAKPSVSASFSSSVTSRTTVTSGSQEMPRKKSTTRRGKEVVINIRAATNSKKYATTQTQREAGL